MTRVLCAGDRFIPGEDLAAAMRAVDPETAAVVVDSDWPDVPFGAVDGVREAAGDPALLAKLAADAEALLTHLAPVTRQVLDAAPLLRVVGVTRGGPVNVDLAAATERGVAVAFLPGRNLEAVAEFTIGVMVTLPRRIASASRVLADGRWDARWFRRELTGPELGANTVGLVGFGAVGRRVAELLQAFGTTVLAHDPYADEAVAASLGVDLVDLAELLARSDIVSVHARLTADSRGLLGREAFAAMKPGAYLVNTARGEFVDHAALQDALQSGRLAGAALDVFDPEPPAPDDPLLRQPNLLATPHLAGASQQVSSGSARRIAEAVGGFLRGGELAHCANPDWSRHRR